MTRKLCQYTASLTENYVSNSIKKNTPSATTMDGLGEILCNREMKVIKLRMKLSEKNVMRSL